MKNTVLPDLDTETIERLKQRFPDLSNVELPKMEAVGKSADETIDRLLGRSRAPIWPWLAAAFGLLAVIGTIAAYLSWVRRLPTETVDSSGADTIEAASTIDSLNGTEAYASTADRAWPAEPAANVKSGTEEA